MASCVTKRAGLRGEVRRQIGQQLVDVARRVDQQPASLALALGSPLLTERMERRPDRGLRWYDRLFSRQDTLSKDGFGNRLAGSPMSCTATARTG